MDLPTQKKYLSANALKYFAIAAMLIDHIGWAFVDTHSVLGQIMHFIGRFTAPIMCYFVAEGYHYTKDLSKYIKRLAVFAVISHFPYVLLLSDVRPIDFIDGRLVFNAIPIVPTSMIFTLLLGLFALHVWKSASLETGTKIFAIILLCIASVFSDWAIFGVLWVLFFGAYRDNKKGKIISYYISAVSAILFFNVPWIMNSSENNFEFYLLGVLFSPLPLLLYNGKRGANTNFNKWFFYAFYPLHLLIISIFNLYFT